MKVVLVNPSLNPEKFGSAHLLMEPMPCIGLAYLAAVLEKDGHSVSIIDNFVESYTVDELVGHVEKMQAEIVGVSVLTPNVNFSKALARALKQNNPDLKLLAGNVHATQFPHEFLEPGLFDYVVRGEGEETVKELVSAIQAGTPFSDVRGISYLKSSGIIHNPDREIIQDLDALPFPAWHLLPYMSYGLFPFADIKKPILTVLASRGCPFSCKYCSLSYMDKKYRKRSAASVASEIEYLIEKFKIRQFGFVDPIFPLEEKHAEELCREFINRGINKKIVWTAETRIDLITENIIKLLYEAGCRRLIFGIETGSRSTLQKIGKNMDPEASKKTIEIMHKYRLQSIGLFMIGLPGETPSSVKETFRYARYLDVDFAKFAMTVPFPGSQLYEDLKREGKIRTDNWDNYTTFNPVPENLSYVPDAITPEELIKLQKRGHMQFYMRPKMIFRQLFKIRTLKPSVMLKGVYTLLR